MNRTPETPRSFLSESTPEFVVISPELVELYLMEIMHMTAMENLSPLLRIGELEREVMIKATDLQGANCKLVLHE